jgi:phosphoenolpyruvate carboxylase
MPLPLRREVRLLGSLLGEALVEYGDDGLLADVERIRRAAIELRRSRGREAEARRRRLLEVVQGLDLGRAEEVARAFTVYFLLVNLAEERQRVRTLRERSRERPVVESLQATVAELRASEPDQLRQVLDRLEIHPVLTAHPTEARRRAVVESLTRIGDLLERAEDARLGEPERAELDRRLREEVAILWRTSQLRRQRPTVLDEVRTAMAVFDATLFRLAPMLYRELDRALSGPDSGLARPRFRAFLQWGSWVGGDRDGNPSVTSDVTAEAMAIQADHVLRGLEAGCRRVGRALTASAATTPPSEHLQTALAAAEDAVGEAAPEVRKRSPAEPHRIQLLLAAERLAATRAGRAGAYPDAAAFLADLRIVQDSLAAAGAPRLAYGELQHLVWQAETFGFHLASLEVRQHAAVHRAALRELAPEAVDDPEALDRLASEGATVGSPSAESAEVLAVFRTMAGLQARWGAQSCRRYVVSFTRSAADLAAVPALARLALPGGPPDLDVVPLFESRSDLEAAPEVLDRYLDLPGTRARLQHRGRLEVMLGYSDSAKDAGFLAANVAIYRAQGRLAAWARGRRVELTLFHGRGGALGRGGGPAGRAIRGQAPGSVAGRFKVTEQGEVVFARYGNPSIGLRHLEQVTSATLLASTAGHERALARAERRFWSDAELMARASEDAYRRLVETPGFAAFFAAVSPLEEIGKLPIGSRPARRVAGDGLESLRAIPWTFAWAQTRVNLPGWYGLGSGLEVVAERQGWQRLRRMQAEWPFFASLIDNAEMSLAKADPMIAGLYLEMGGRPDLVEAIRNEFRRTRRAVREVTGTPLLARRPVLRRAVELRNPYVDALSFLQLRFLRQLRFSPDEDRERLAELTLLTLNGVAAGLQNTG